MIQTSTSASTSLKLERMEIPLAKAYLRLFPSARFRIYQMLGRLIDAELDARSALEFIYEVLSQDGKKKGELDAVAVSHWLRAYQEHGRLSEALSGWVPQTEVLLLEAGERSGRFQHALEVMLRLNSKLSSIRFQIAGKLAYPILSALALSGMLYFLATEFIPPILAIKGDAGQWTGTAGSLVEVLLWVNNGLFPTLIGVVALIIGVAASMPYFKGPVRNLFDHMPPWSLHRFISGTGFLTALLVLMESGRGLVESLGLIRPNTSPYMAAKLEKIETAMREGESFGKALAQDGDQFPDIELIKEIQIYGRIGKLDEGLLKVVEQWMDTATNRALSQIGVLGMVIMAGTFIALGFVMTGLYDIIGQLKQGY